MQPSKECTPTVLVQIPEPSSAACLEKRDLLESTVPSSTANHHISFGALALSPAGTAILQ